MTTIAFDGRYVAADSLQGSHDRNNSEPAVKLIRKDRFVYGICGYFSLFDAFIEWHQAGADPEKLPVCKYAQSDSTFIVFDGLKCVTFSLELPYPDIAYAGEAFGSGRKYAEGAMAFGATAEQAVEVAIRLDPGSGGPVQVIDLQVCDHEWLGGPNPRGGHFVACRKCGEDRSTAA